MNKLLNTKYPIIQGAMANITDGKFAATVSNAGGLGVIATGSLKANQVAEEIRACKALTKNPFGVNVMLKNPEADAIIKVIIEEKVPVVTTGAGNPAKYLKSLKEANIKIFPVVASKALAIRLSRYDIDGLIVEGGESGGHVAEQSSLTLIPQVSDVCDLPIIAAGGIADGRGLLAAKALGATAVQIGTCLLVADECKIHDNYKELVIKAKDTSTVVTGRSKNTPVRIYKNQMAKEYLKLEKSSIDEFELEKLTLGSLKKAVIDGDIKAGSFMMGQVAGLINKRQSVKSIICGIYQEYLLEKEKLINLED